MHNDVAGQPSLHTSLVSTEGSIRLVRLTSIPLLVNNEELPKLSIFEMFTMQHITDYMALNHTWGAPIFNESIMKEYKGRKTWPVASSVPKKEDSHFVNLPIFSD